MSRGGYERLPMYASSESTTRLRSPTSFPKFLPPPLPSSRHRRHRSWKDTLPRPSPRHMWTVLKIVIPGSLLLIIALWILYEPHIELSFYPRDWINHQVAPVQPLSGCFDVDRVSSLYNVTQNVYGPRRIEVQAGMGMRMGLDCYNFAGTIQKVQNSREGEEGERTNFHTYWRTDLAPFGPRQEWLLKSFFSTQDLSATRLILWSNGDLSHNSILVGYLSKYPAQFALRIADMPDLARGTELEGSELLENKDKKAWTDGDLVRLLLLWNFGGVWVDMDSLLTRDLDPLLEHEFVTQWDCYDKIYQPFNGALMRFRIHSPYLCEAFHIIRTSPAPRPGTTDWGSTLYLKLWRRLVAASIPPFKVLPFCFSDGRSCRLDNRLPDPFTPDGRGEGGKGIWGNPVEVEGWREGGRLDKALEKVFAVHLHNQWEKRFPEGGWVERLLLKRYDKRLGEMKREK